MSETFVVTFGPVKIATGIVGRPLESQTPIPRRVLGVTLHDFPYLAVTEDAGESCRYALTHVGTGAMFSGIRGSFMACLWAALEIAAECERWGVDLSGDAEAVIAQADKLGPILARTRESIISNTWRLGPP